MLDALIATSIIVFSIILIYSFHATKPYQMQGLFLAADTMDLLTKTKVYEVNNAYLLNLTYERNITNTGNSLMEQTAEFYSANKTELAEKFLINVTQGMVPTKYGFELRIYNSTNFYNKTINSGDTLQNDSALVLVSKDIISGMNDDFTVWGPLTAEVRIWR